MNTFIKSFLTSSEDDDYDILDIFTATSRLSDRRKPL